CKLISVCAKSDSSRGSPPCCRKAGGTLSRRVRGRGKVKHLRSIAVRAVSHGLTATRVPVGARPGEKFENSKHPAAGIGKPGFWMRRPTELGRSRVARCGRLHHGRPAGRCDPARI